MTVSGNHLFGYRFLEEEAPIRFDPVSSDQSIEPERDSGFEWVHVHGSRDHLQATLHTLIPDPLIVAALASEETRPRCTPKKGGAIMILRGVNLNDGAQPEDMISLRMWVDASRIVTCGLRSLKALDDVVDMIESGRAPGTTGEMVALFAVRLADRAEPVVSELNERVDEIEEDLEIRERAAIRKVLAEIRRTAIVLRRYMFPQRDALTTLEVEGFNWISSVTLGNLREAVERVTRLCEELDSIRDRSQVVHDQYMDQQAEHMNRQMWVLTLVAAFFLPIGFLTGLLGMNVGGVPMIDSPSGFWVVCGLIVFILILEFLIFKKLKLF